MTTRTGMEFVYSDTHMRFGIQHLDSLRRGHGIVYSKIRRQQRIGIECVYYEVHVHFLSTLVKTFTIRHLEKALHKTFNGVEGGGWIEIFNSFQGA